MQCPPPRPLPSSKPSMVMTSTPGLAHLGDRVGVALVGDDHARLQRDDVVGVVPLLALLLVARRRPSRPRGAWARRGRRPRPRGSPSPRVTWKSPAFLPGRRLIARIWSTTFGIDGDLVAVEHGEDRVEVHVGAVLGHHAGDDALRAALGEQGWRSARSSAPWRPLGHADQDRAVADGLDVAALQRRPPEVARRRTGRRRRAPGTRTRSRRPRTSDGSGRSRPCCRPRAAGPASTSG